MKESKTTYSYLIEHMEEPSFEKVWDIAFDFVQKLPSELCNELHDSLNRGIDILDSEPLLQMYIYSFGKMHNAKLQYAFNHVQKPIINYEEVEIVDYGCGQGLASICYHDYIIKHNRDQRVRKITLIEPSELALSRAELLCSRFYPDAEIVAVNKQFDDLTNDDLVLSSDIPTIHLLSNILDVESYDLPHLSHIVKEQSVGDNEYISVSPMQNPQRLERLKKFATLIDKVVYFEQYLERRQLNEDKDWTCAVILCSNSLKLDCETVFEEALSFIHNKDKDINSEYCFELFDRLKLCAEQGDKKCQNQLGIWYHKGIGTVQDYLLALEWYKKSADQEYPAAFGNIGILYIRGQGVEKDPIKAVEYFKIGVKLNHPGCLLIFGICLFKGIGIEKDNKKAFNCFKKAAKSDGDDLGKAYYYLYLCYLNGKGTKKDETAAIKALKKAANLKHKKSCFVLAELYESGKYIEKDEKKALRFYKKSADLGYLQAWEKLGDIYRSGLLGQEKAPKKSFNWYLKAAEQGSSSSQFYIGYYYSTGNGIKEDPGLAFEWYSQSAQQNNSAAINNLAFCYERGKGVDVDSEKAISLYEKAARLGNVRAQKNAANCYRYGKGVTPDAEKYFYWTHEAAKNKDIESAGKIAFYYFIGFGTNKSHEDALIWYARYYSKFDINVNIEKCDDAFNYFKNMGNDGDPQALYIVGKCIQYGISTDKNFEKAYTYFRKAADLGHIESIIKVGEWSSLDKLCSAKADKIFFKDSYKVKYSLDEKVLLSCDYYKSKIYKVRYGTRIISNGAFYHNGFNKIIIPPTVLFMGTNPFPSGPRNIECHSPNYIVVDNALYSRDKKELISYFGYENRFTIPHGVEIIGEGAFAENNELTEVVFPNSLHTIKERAFEYCLNIERIVIPEKVTNLGAYCFLGCESLSEVSLKGAVRVLPSGIFMGCNLKRIDLPKSISEIHHDAFHSNYYLTEVNLPNSLIKLGDSCFAFCDNLKSIKLNDELREIGDFCFMGCPISTITIPSKVKKIGLNPFIGISHIECEGNNTFISDNGLLYNKENGELIAHFDDEEVALYPPISRVKSFAFYGSKVTNLFMGKNIAIIEPWAFYMASKLESVIWKSCTVKRITTGCFAECTSLVKIDIPLSVEEIEKGSFIDCTSLRKIRFCNPKTKVNEEIFKNFNRIKQNLSLPEEYLSRNIHINNIQDSYKRNIDISTFTRIEILVPSGCRDNYSFSAIYDKIGGGIIGEHEYGMDRDFIIEEYEQ